MNIQEQPTYAGEKTNRDADQLKESNLMCWVLHSMIVCVENDIKYRHLVYNNKLITPKYKHLVYNTYTLWPN